MDVSELIWSGLSGEAEFLFTCRVLDKTGPLGGKVALVSPGRLQHPVRDSRIGGYSDSAILYAEKVPSVISNLII